MWRGTNRWTTKEISPRKSFVVFRHEAQLRVIIWCLRTAVEVTFRLRFTPCKTAMSENETTLSLSSKTDPPSHEEDRSFRATSGWSCGSSPTACVGRTKPSRYCRTFIKHCQNLLELEIFIKETLKYRLNCLKLATDMPGQIMWTIFVLKHFQCYLPIEPNSQIIVNHNLKLLRLNCLKRAKLNVGFSIGCLLAHVNNICFEVSHLSISWKPSVLSQDPTVLSGPSSNEHKL